jgi:hypothetical protein
VKIDYHLASSLRAASAAPDAGGVLPSLGLLGRGGRHGAVAGLTQHAPCLLRGRQSDLRPPLARSPAYLMYDVCNVLRES